MHLLDCTKVLAISLLVSLVNCSTSSSRTTPPDGAVIVDKDGSDGAYTTVQDGVDALSTTATGEQYLFIYPGVYSEQVYIAPRAANLTIQGYTSDAASYAGNTVNITWNLALADTTSDDMTATVRAWAKNLKMYNINILNTYGRNPKNGQALALSAQASGQGYYGLGLYSYQDTLLAETGLQLYSRSMMVGAVDFIFGQKAQAWLEEIDIRTVGAGSITASGRSEDNTSWYVINNSTVKGVNATIEAEVGINYLGRPWRDYARVTFQQTYLSQVVNAAGWDIWNKGDNNTDFVTFEEYENYGPGSYPTEGPRAGFSSQLAEPRKIEDILGDGYLDEWWVDDSYLS